MHGVCNIVDIEGNCLGARLPAFRCRTKQVIGRTYTAAFVNTLGIEQPKEAVTATADRARQIREHFRVLCQVAVPVRKPSRRRLG
jgi:hypothetical protein